MRLFLITLIAFVLMGASLDDARKANEAYNEGNYEQAIPLYKKAIDDDPQNAKLYYNLASAQAKAGLSQEAIRTFEQYKTMTGDAVEQAKANYNIGKVLSDSKQWSQAVEYYKKSLRYMADDPDAKHNYELAKKKQEEQKKQQKKQKQQNNQQQDQNQQQKQDQQQQNNRQKKQQQQQKQGQNQDQQKSQSRQPQKMSKKEAEKILKALEQKEKELLKQFRKQKTESSKSTNEKDW